MHDHPILRLDMPIDDSQLHRILPLRRALSDRLARPLRPLPRRKVLALLTGHDVGSLLHDLLTLGQDHLDVAWVRHCTQPLAFRTRQRKGGPRDVLYGLIRP